MSKSSAMAINSALVETVAGNNEIIKGFQLAVDLNVTKLISYQNNLNCMFRVGVLAFEYD